jgi:hypothetical protein
MPDPAQLGSPVNQPPPLMPAPVFKVYLAVFAVAAGAAVAVVLILEFLW